MPWIASYCRLAMCLVVATIAPSVFAAHGVALQGNGKLAILAADGSIEWEMPWSGIHDIHVLANGNLMVQQGKSKVVEIDRQSKQIVWQYDSATQNGNEGKPVEVHSFQPLADGRVMIAETTALRIIEVNRDGQILKTVAMKVEHPHPHTDTRLVRKLANGNYLACHEGDGYVREYDGKTGTVTWEYQVPMFGRQAAPGHGPEAFGNKAFAAVRLASGNTLITTGNGHSVIEVTPAKELVWKFGQEDLPTITLAWITTLEVLPNGNYVLGNCHAGPGNPLLIEIDPKTKQVVWTLDRFDDFGNSVSNSQILPPDERVLR
ncbi:MAG: PQQ-binding-like beta-propeller repeat protein [Planctomycetaceae bacterium]